MIDKDAALQEEIDDMCDKNDRLRYTNMRLEKEVSRLKAEISRLESDF